MLLYKDEEFQDKWTTVPSLTLEDNIYVKVFMVCVKQNTHYTLLMAFEKAAVHFHLHAALFVSHRIKAFYSCSQIRV